MCVAAPWSAASAMLVWGGATPDLLRIASNRNKSIDAPRVCSPEVNADKPSRSEWSLRAADIKVSSFSPTTRKSASVDLFSFSSSAVTACRPLRHSSDEDLLNLALSN